MPSRKTIKITSITKGKKGLYTVKTTGKSFYLTEDAVADRLLYVGKELTPLEINVLKKSSSMSSISTYAHSLFLHHSYSALEVRKKLATKYKSSKDIPEVIYNLKKEHLIDDKRYAEEYAEMKSSELYGEKKIIDDLRFLKGIDDEIIQNLSFDNEAENAKSFVKIAQKKYASLPLAAKKTKLKNSLIRRGFAEDIASIAVSNLRETKDTKYQAKLTQDAKSALVRYGRKYNGYELRSKTFSYLLSKGYKPDEIEKAIKENSK